MRPIRPNAGLAAAYEKRLLALIDAMASGLSRSILSQYRSRPPVAQDASPAAELASVIRRLSQTWLKRFDEAAPELARWFADRASDNVDRGLRFAARDHAGLMAILRKGGFTVRFTMTAEQRDVMSATVAENVALIRSIPEEHLKSVEGLVMRSVSTGRDLATLSDGLRKAHGVTKRRAAMIALDQNNKATAALARQRQLQLGLTKAKWLHSVGGKTKRPTHVEQSGKPYSIKDGIVLDPKEGIVWPGTAIRCRCVSVAIVPGWDD